MKKIANIALPQIKTFPIMISGGYHAQVRLFLPPGLREDEITRYPLILHVYVYFLIDICDNFLFIYNILYIFFL